MTGWQESIFRIIFLGLALAVVPITYAALCAVMLFRRVRWFSYLAQFILFGTFGGWCLTLALSPSAFAAVGSLFLFLISPLPLLASIFLQIRKDRNLFDSVAMAGGYTYTVFLAALILGPMVWLNTR